MPAAAARLDVATCAGKQDRPATTVTRRSEHTGLVRNTKRLRLYSHNTQRSPATYALAQAHVQWPSEGVACRHLSRLEAVFADATEMEAYVTEYPGSLSRAYTSDPRRRSGHTHKSHKPKFQQIDVPS